MQHTVLFYIFQLAGELSKDISLYYHIGHLIGHSSYELMLLVLYSHFSYKLSFYLILMSKYLALSSFPLLVTYLHQQILTLNLDTFYFQLLTHVHLLHVFWPDCSLDVATHLNSPTRVTQQNK